MGVSDGIGEFLSKMAGALGLKPSEMQKLKQLEQQLAQQKATEIDQIEEIKSEIRQLEGRALKKKKELDASRGDSKRVITGEIERTFRDLDRLKGREGILTSNIEKVSTLLAKTREIITAKQGAERSVVKEDMIDDLAISAEEAFDDLRRSDKAVAGLDSVKYEAPAQSEVDVDGRMSDLDGTEKSKSKLSPDIERRLKELEEE